ATTDLQNDPLFGEQVVELGDVSQPPSRNLVALNEPQVLVRLVGFASLPLVSEASLRLRLLVQRNHPRDAVQDVISVPLGALQAAGNHLVLGISRVDDLKPPTILGVQKKRDRAASHG